MCKIKTKATQQFPPRQPNNTFLILLLFPMAISFPLASTPPSISSQTTDHPSTFLCSSSSSSSSSLFSLSPLHLRRQLRIGAATSLSLRRHSRLLPLVKAKKETFSNFDELIAKSDKPVLVDFYAVWCGPCQFMNPILEKVSASLKDKVQVVKIDTEKYTSIANKYQIEALPTFILFKDGNPCDRFEGALPAEKLIERVETALAVKQ